MHFSNFISDLRGLKKYYWTTVHHVNYNFYREQADFDRIGHDILNTNSYALCNI